MSKGEGVGRRRAREEMDPRLGVDSAVRQADAAGEVAAQ
jgi:hypothetical protein